MKKILLYTLVLCFILSLFTGCGALLPKQSADSEQGVAEEVVEDQQKPADSEQSAGSSPSESPSSPNQPSESPSDNLQGGSYQDNPAPGAPLIPGAGVPKPNDTETPSTGGQTPADSNSPTFDKTAAEKNNKYSIKIPSDWSYKHDIDMDDASIFYLILECPNTDSYMWTQQVILDKNTKMEDYKKLMKENFNTTDFVFTDGGKGYCRKINDYTDFVYFTSNGALIFSVNYSTDTQWYNKNVSLLTAIAKTLTLHASS